MKITPDTNLLIRVVMNDDTDQAEAARRCLAEADAIFFTLPALCEAAWVLKSFYGASREEVGTAIRALTGAATSVFDAAAVSTGLKMLETGGDFADGVIASAGITMGSETFVSFDKGALKRLEAVGIAVQPVVI